jgi:hypothetical protein
MTNQDDTNPIKEYVNTISLSSGLSDVDAEKLVSILLPAVAKCKEFLSQEDLQDQQFIRYIVAAANMATLRFLQNKDQDS